MRNGSLKPQDISGNTGPVIQQEVAAGRLEDALRRRVGRGKRHSFQSLSEHTGIAQRTLESYVSGNCPNLSNFLSLCDVLGPGFTSDVLGVIDQSARGAGEDEPEYLAVAGKLGAAVAQIAEALADGHVDHRETTTLRATAQELIDALEPLARAEAKLRAAS